MENVLMGDPFYSNIIKYLNAIDLYKLTKVCTHYRNTMENYIEKNIIEEINKRLYEIFGADLPEFKKVLCDTNSVISGSFILQCILGEHWDNSDIDIYIPMKGNNITQNMPASPNPISSVENFIYSKGIKWVTFDSDVGYGKHINNTIHFVREYKNKNMKYALQTILVNIDKNIDTLYDFIKDNFDFNICKNIYYFDTKDNIRIYKINEIMNKKTNFTVGYRLGSSIMRVKKYEDRGFQFLNKNNLSYENYFDEKNTQIMFEIKLIGNIKKDYRCKICNCNIYEVIKGNISILKQAVYFGSYGRGIEVNDNNLILPDDGYHRQCDDNCIIKFCKSDVKHLHYNGIVTNEGEKTDFIFVVV